LTGLPNAFALWGLISRSKPNQPELQRHELKQTAINCVESTPRSGISVATERPPPYFQYHQWNPSQQDVIRGNRKDTAVSGHQIADQANGL
jgi:hypothetical protein